MTSRRAPGLRDGRIVLPGVASAHSHAFQRALRGRAQRSRTAGGSFWSWRGLMYALAERLDPDTLFDVARYAFTELAACGVTAVGEFHYLHHGPRGVPYAERTLLSDTVIRAALEAGLRVTLLRVVYRRAGYGRALEAAQRRFGDASLDHAVQDVEALLARWKDEPRVRIGLAPHSVRAVEADALRELATFARARGLPLHAHVSEQRREVRECLAEHGMRPVALLAEVGALGPSMTAVHATHLDDAEAAALGRARACVCVCRTTERDLGDGLPDLARLAAAGARFSVGADSHASADPFEEARAMELDERTRAEGREVALDADAIGRALGPDGHASIGWDLDTLDDEVALDARDPAIDAVVERDDAAALADAIAWQASPRAVRTVRVAGRTVVDEGRHVAFAGARAAYERALRTLLA
jgi:formiminoglutamate deiminase